MGPNRQPSDRRSNATQFLRTGLLVSDSGALKTDAYRDPELLPAACPGLSGGEQSVRNEPDEGGIPVQTVPSLFNSVGNKHHGPDS